MGICKTFRFIPKGVFFLIAIFLNLHYLRGFIDTGSIFKNLHQQQNRELKESGVSDMIIHGSVNLEVKIRSLFAMQGLELNYEQTVEERRNQYPKPRDLDKKLKETIAPFRWFSDTGRYSLSLEAGLLNEDSFTKSNMLGNGYDWEKTLKEFALAFHKFTMDRNAFEELLERSKSGD